MTKLTSEQIDQLEDWIGMMISPGIRRTQFLEALRLARMQLEREEKGGENE